MHCLIGIKQRSQNRTIVPISASIGESKTSESDPLSGRVVPETHQDNPKWHTSEKNRPFRLPNRGSQCAQMGILRTGQDAILGVVRLDFLSASASAKMPAMEPKRLLCPICGGQMRLIAFITNTAVARKILEHIGVDSQPPRITPPRGPPLWDNCDASADEVLDALPDWDQTAQPEPDDCANQRIHW